MKLIKYIRSRISMKKTGIDFWDCVGHETVYVWEDRYGVLWLAASKWGFRSESILNKCKYERNKH